MNTQIKERNIVIVVLLYFFTFGIYPIYIFFKFGAELQREALIQRTPVQLTHPLIALLLGFITFGIYSLYYVYKQAVVLEQIGRKYNFVSISPVLILFTSIFLGVGLLFNVYSASMIVQRIENPHYINY